ncbi:hypothetical protein [Rickettsia asembonensis]|uniref:hypothetical protein n=1 Tax=Rickettsia asembonensis TaxID=1068590 RepID=UPI00130E0FD5|nr:hypothetical protein [Rickettsia asembonensis]
MSFPRRRESSKTFIFIKYIILLIIKVIFLDSRLRGNDIEQLHTKTAALFL